MLTGERTNLRAVERDDIGLIHAWLDNPELMWWWGYGASATSRTAVQQRVQQWIESEGAIGHPAALIVETLDGDPAGFVVLSDVQSIDRSAELSLFLMSEYRGKGLGGGALDTILDASFQHWNLHRLTVHCEAHNQRAHVFFLQHGFVREGQLREARFIDGAWSDILIFGQVAGERTMR